MTSFRQPRRASVLAAFALLAATSPALMSCAPLIQPVKANRGYLISEKELKKITPLQTTQAQVAEYMGSPSTTSSDDGVAWYYINSKTEAYLFFPPEEVERTIIAVYFDKTDVVQEVLYYGLEDGEVVDIQTRKTPTRGKELTILGQLFGNLGRYNDTGEKPGAIKPGGGR
jgi:outer membrane protein assembly factor BamE (lipoprotein component of BamABCDE complex)